MKSIRNLLTLAGLSVVLFALGATAAKAQTGPALSTTDLSGTFTLPLAAQWGGMALPAGNYTLHYGRLNGFDYVEVRGTDKGSPHGLIPAQQPDSTSAKDSAIVCVREGDTLVVRGLEMPAIGESVRFPMPRGAQLVAHQRNGSKNIQLAAAPMLMERIPVTLNGK